MKERTKKRGRAHKAFAYVLAGAIFAATLVSAVPSNVFAESGDETYASGTDVDTVAAINGLQIWYDANDITAANGARIDRLVNKATPILGGAGDAVQQSGAARPIYVAESDINGRPAIRFNAQSFMRVGGESGFYLDDMTIVAVGNIDYDGNGTREIFSRLNGEPHNHNWYFNCENGFNFGWGSLNGTNVTHHQACVKFDSGEPAVFVGRKANGSGTSMVNGAVCAEFNGHSPQDVKKPVYLGGYHGNSVDGDIGEILVFDRGLSDTELKSVNDYLFRKWSFENNDGCTLDGIYIGDEKIDGFSPYRYTYEILAKDGAVMDEITAITRYDNASVEKKTDKNSVELRVTNPKCNAEKTYRITLKVLPDVADRLTRVADTDVRLNDGYWKQTIGQYMTYSLDYVYDMFDFSYSFDNFDRIAAGERKILNNTSEHAGSILAPIDDNRLIGDRDGRWGWVNEPWREGLIYEEIRAVSDFISMYADDPELGEKARELKERTSGYVDRIVAAGLTCTGSDRNGRRIDGYFDTFVMLTQTGVIDEAESGHIWNHDMYNFGCIVEAGISWYKATGDTKLLFIATRFAEFMVDYMYGENGYDVVPSHQLGEETLLALYALYENDAALTESMKATYYRYEGIDPDDRYYNFDIRWRKYIDIVRDWIEKRGVTAGRYNNASYGDYAQDHATYDKQTIAAGHSVRANLWYSAIAAAGNYLDNDSYIAAANTIWNNIVGHQMYVNGGTGSVHATESYGGDDYLPHDGYCETCAAVGMGFYALNMSDIFGSAEYADVLELELYNGILGCLGADGQSFYYQNPVMSDDYRRPLWSGATPCCPPMYMKFFSKLPTYIYSYNADKLVVNQYISSSANITVGDTAVEINQFTDLPDGNIAVFDVKATGNFVLQLRNPYWAKSADVKINGKSVSASINDCGYIVIDREWSGTTRIEIVFGKQAERVYQNNAKANSGQVAFRYGPFLYCAESDDNTVGGEDIVSGFATIPNDAKLSVEYVSDMFTYKTDENGKQSFKRGTNVIKTDAVFAGRKTVLTLIPYYLRDNRTHSSMRVWFWEETRNIGGKNIFTFDDRDSLRAFDFYGNTNGWTWNEGTLKSDPRAEGKAVSSEYKDLSEFTVSVDITAASTYLNNGLYVLASEPSNEKDKINALNVQIERDTNADVYRVNIFRFSGRSGYLGKLAESKAMAWTGDPLTLSVTVGNGIVSVTVNGLEATRYVLTDADPKSGGVGMRSMMCAAYYDNFTVMHAGIPLHKDALSAALNAASAIDLSAYKSQSAERVRAAITVAQAVLQDAVSDTELDRAQVSLAEAVGALEKKSDTAALEAVIAAAEKIKLSEYTEESAKTLAYALEAAKLIGGDDAQDDVDNATALLRSALDGLVKKPSGVDSDGVNGLAIGLGVGGAVVAAGAAAAAALVVRSRKKKNIPETENKDSADGTSDQPQG